MNHSAAVVESVCGNCGAALVGTYCHVCGQKATGPDVSLHDFFHEAFHEFAHVDGKIIRTLRLLLTKPGSLTKEFLSGRRTRYISPFVFTLRAACYFSLWPRSHSTRGSRSSGSRTGPHQARSCLIRRRCNDINRRRRCGPAAPSSTIFRA